MTALPFSAFRSLPHLLGMVLSLLLLAGQSCGQDAPAAPTGVRVSLSHLADDITGVMVSWTDNSADETSFQVYLTSVSQSVPMSHLATAPANATQTHLRLDAAFFPPDATLYCWVAAANDSGFSEYSSVGTIANHASLQVHEPPADLVVTASSSNTIRIEWSDRSNSEEYTEIWARDTGVRDRGYELLAQVLWNVTTHDMEDYLQPGRTYELALRTSRSAGVRHNSEVFHSLFSEPVTFAMPGIHSDSPPPPPSNLSLAAFADATSHGFGVYFDDNATDETSYEIQSRASDASDDTFATLGTIPGTLGANLGVGALIGGHSEDTSCVFRVRAVRGNGPFAIVSEFSESCGAVASALDAPTNLRTSAPSTDGRVQLFWSDNATEETGYQIEFRLGGSGDFTSLGIIDSPECSRYQVDGGIGGFTPGAMVQFQVRAVRGGLPASGPSNVATVTIPAAPFQKPANLVATVSGEATVHLTWKDNSSVESNFQLLAREAGAAEYQVIATPAANATSASVTMTPGLVYEFALAAVHAHSGEEVLSELTEAAQCQLPFHAPSDLLAVAATDRQINLRWVDNSTSETGYAIYCKRNTDSAFQICGVVSASQTSFSTSHVDAAGRLPLEPNTTYLFEVRAYAGLSGDLAVSNPAVVDSMAVRTFATTGSAMTKDGVTAALAPPMLVNQSFSHPFTVTQGQAAISSSHILGPLPPGIVYDSVTRTLSGTPTACGPYTPTLVVKWANGWTSAQTIHLRPHFRPGPPVVKTPIADHALTLGDSPLSIPLEFAFSDPDAESAVALQITGADGTPGSRRITIILNDSVTPLTVANFRSYLLNGSDGYMGSVFHRLVPDFVLQGGAFRSAPQPTAHPSGLASITKLSPIQNEPGLPNIAGTVAMAKMSSDPHSATSDFFFNLADNSASLDRQNEGFSVFARVSQPSVAALMELAALPQETTEAGHAVPVIPAESPAAEPEASQLVRVDAISTDVPVLVDHRATSSDQGVATASISGTDLSLSPVAPGTSTISLQVSDLDGNQLKAPLTFEVTVNNTLSNWATTEGLTSGQTGPTDDPDFDGRKNLLEYALMSSPGTANGSAEPALNTITDGADKKATITFKVRKFAALTYAVEGSSDLTTWTPVWTSTSGFAGPAVSASVNNADHTLVTIKDSVPYSDTTPRFLQLKVTAP
ncbi:MAG: peptidylprolyl isomerase [Verrucomicrobiaceae bacterium]|nr:peptidylprolyl isomerase [Verrucomicrobiaceae bacterium]